MSDINMKTDPLVLNGILSFIHNPFNFFNGHHLTGETERLSEQGSTNNTRYHRYLKSRFITYLVHFLQTFISNFQPLNNFHFDLGELQVLDLKRAEKTQAVSLEFTL